MKVKVFLLLFVVSIMFSGCESGENVKVSVSPGDHPGNVFSLVTSKPITNEYATTREFKKGEAVEFRYASTLAKGTLSLQLVDPEGVVVYDFNPGIKDIVTITFEVNGTYTIKSVLEEFVGTYDIKWPIAKEQ